MAGNYHSSHFLGELTLETLSCPLQLRLGIERRMRTRKRRKVGEKDVCYSVLETGLIYPGLAITHGIAEDAPLESLGYRRLLPSLTCVVLENEPRASCMLGMCFTNHSHSPSLVSGIVCQLTGLGHYKLLKLFSSFLFSCLLSSFSLTFLLSFFLIFVKIHAI